MFSLQSTTAIGRRGVLTLPHGTVRTPFFLPVATGGAMRGVSFADIETLGFEALLCNTYHLHLRPGDERIANAGGLHRFIGWDKPILTDSGGFQVFSLKDIRKIEEDGVRFQSHIDGSPLFLGPREATRIQHNLGADIRMCFDHCPPSTAPRSEQIAAVDRTIRWAKTCKEVHETLVGPMSSNVRPMLFGIVQGGLELDLRKKCAEELIAIGFDGYAIGGLAVGETPEEMLSVVEYVTKLLPADKPRYLMGVGRIEQMRAAIAHGIDMFDCVLPMREARHGSVYLTEIERVRILNASYLDDHSPIDADSLSPLSRRHSKSYLSYLLRIGERYGETIACMQNLAVTARAVDGIRSAITAASA